MSVVLGLGSVVGGDFRIDKPLRSGGMGDVFVAHQIGLDRPCALKLMQANLARDERFRERFAREAKLATQIESDHVVKVLAAGIDEGSGTPWIAMELLRGVELSEHLADRKILEEAEAVDILAQIAHAVGAAHAQGIVHRDLKPENVFLADSRAVTDPADGAPTSSRYLVKILDFGIAKVVSETHVSSTASIGSPTWMAPEQTMRGKTVVPATDVWAMGLIAFRMLTGESYWLSLRDAEATPLMVVSEMMFEPLEPASVRADALGVKRELPPWFDPWFARCVARDASARYATASEAFAALEELQRSPPASFELPIDQPLRPGAARARAIDPPTRAEIEQMPTQPVDVAPRARVGDPVSKTRVVAVSERSEKKTATSSGPLELGSVHDDSAPPARSNARTFLLVGLSAAVLVGLFVLSSTQNNDGAPVAAASGTGTAEEVLARGDVVAPTVRPENRSKVAPVAPPPSVDGATPEPSATAVRAPSSNSATVAKKQSKTATPKPKSVPNDDDPNPPSSYGTKATPKPPAPTYKKEK